MLIKKGQFLVLVIISLYFSKAYAFEEDYRFVIQNRPEDQTEIGFRADAVNNTIVFDKYILPTEIYNTATCFTRAGGTTAGFDFCKDDQPSNQCPPLGYGIYKISVLYESKSAYFFLDLRDCYYGSPHPIEPPEGSDYVSPPYDMCFIYDFSTDKFSGERRTTDPEDKIQYFPIANNETIGIWFIRSDYPLNDQACTECFNPKVSFYNKTNVM